MLEGCMTIPQLLRPILKGKNIRRPVRFVRSARTERATKIAQALMLRSLWMTGVRPLTHCARRRTSP